MSSQEDKRVVRTKARLLDTFKSLLCEKNFEKISVTPAKNDLSRGLVVKGNTKHPFGKDESDETQSSYQCFQGTPEGRDRAVQKHLHP